MKTLKLTLLSLAALGLVGNVLLFAGGLRFGITGAVKAQVEELDKKVREKKAATATTTAPKVSFVITSIKEGASSSAPSLVQRSPAAMKVSPFDVIKTSFTVNPSTSYCWIISGAPEYIKVTLKKIDIRTSPTSTYNAWTGSKELTIDGSGNVDTSGIDISVTTDTITAIRLTFATDAKIKGSVKGWINISTYAPTEASNYVQKTFYTKSSYFYNAVTHTGGATSYTLLESSPAEEASISLGGYSGDTTIELPVPNGNITTSTATLTVLMDLDRMLRFYDGLSTQGVEPEDLANKAYFFCHSIFGGSVAAFIGTPGTIQGYRTHYAAYKATDPIGSTTPEEVYGWMTLIFDSGGSLISGILIGDDDNALTVAKGKITSYSGSTFQYEIDNGQSAFKVENFVKQTTLNSSTPVATWTQPVVKPGTTEYHGEAIYTLLFQR